jgi:ribonucleotide monophosphatase NagD (HAD superfamily)
MRSVHRVTQDSMRTDTELIWSPGSTGYHLPRFGQGAFQSALRGVWARITGGEELVCTVIGKPYRETYRFAERKLALHRRDVLARLQGKDEVQSQEGEPARLRTVYMIGDNPESDIAGANDFISEIRADWVSILVETGVWNPERTGGIQVLNGRFRPKMAVRGVQDGVRWALDREGWTAPSSL